MELFVDSRMRDRQVLWFPGFVPRHLGLHAPVEGQTSTERSVGVNFGHIRARWVDMKGLCLFQMVEHLSGPFLSEYFRVGLRLRLVGTISVNGL
jgi:hypothetical protein